MDNYNDNEEENILYFFIKYFIEYEGEYKEMPITLLINKNLRLLAETEETIKCHYLSDSSNVYIFNCSLNYTGQSIQSIKVKPPENSTDYAIYTCNNVKDQKGNLIPTEAFPVTDYYIADLDKNVILNGNIKDVNIPNNTQSILYVKEDNSNNENPQEIPLTFIKKESNDKNYDMKLDLKKSLDADLNEKSGIVNINNEKKTYILSFRTNSSNLDYEYMPSTNKPYKKESSSGLSGGSIVAVANDCYPPPHGRDPSPPVG